MSNKKNRAAAIDALLGLGKYQNLGKPADTTSVVDSSEEPNKPTNIPAPASRASGRSSLPGVVADAPSPTPPQRKTLSKAADRDDIGVVQRIHKSCYVIDSKDDFNKISLQGGVRVFVSPTLVKPWSFHDRAIAGKPDISDIATSIQDEGQEEPSTVRLQADGFELVSGFRRFTAVQDVSGMYLLAEVYTTEEMNDQTAYAEMTRENDLERKKPVPISCQVESDELLLQAGVFKSRRELSIKAGKNDKWSSQNLNYFNMLPDVLRNILGKTVMALATQSDYRKVGAAFDSVPAEQKDEAIKRACLAAELWLTTNKGDARFPSRDLVAAIRPPVDALPRMQSVQAAYAKKGRSRIVIDAAISKDLFDAIVADIEAKVKAQNS